MTHLGKLVNSALVLGMMFSVPVVAMAQDSTSRSAADSDSASCCDSQKSVPPFLPGESAQESEVSFEMLVDLIQIELAEEALYAFSRPLFEHIEHHRHGTAGRMGTRGWALVHEHLRRVIAERISDDVERALESSRQRTPSIPRDLLAQCVAAAFVLTLNWWVESGSRVSANEADGHFRSLALPMLHVALGP